MQEKSTQNVNYFLSRLKSALKLKSDADLCRHLGINPSTLSNWKSRKSLDYELIFDKCKDIDFHFVITGEHFQNNTSHIVKEERASYGNAKQVRCEQCDLRERLIEAKDLVILSLQARIKDLDQNKH
jgi:hypothetical protein